MIENAQDDDVGYYECVASNQMGEVKSRKAKMVSEEQQDEAINEAGMLAFQFVDYTNIVVIQN